MTGICEIVQLGAPILRQLAETVSDFDAAETRRIMIALQDTLAGTQGVGIAAPQIGASKRIIIVASRPTQRYPYAPLMVPTVMINPSYQALSDQREKDWEGCLSIPSIRALVPRYKDIMVSYSNPEGEVSAIRLEGFIARVFQHELDHLDGKVYLDRVEDNGDIYSESEYLKLRLDS